jgi:hypothetical protein
MRSSIAVLAAGVSLACLAEQPITGVTVWDADFKVVKKLAVTELPEFERAWNAKTEVKVELSKVGGQHFKLDIAKGTTSGARWLYQTTGYVQLLTVKAGKPAYKLNDPQAFNRLIGATK